MTENNLAIPTTLVEPRCFILEPVINVSQAYAQAGEHKSKAFGFDIRRMFSGRPKDVETKLIHRRLVPFWNIRCRSHFDFSRLRDYTINACDSDAVMLTIQGADKSGNQTEAVYRVDQSGRSGGQVKLTGIERCVKDREVTEWIDSYTQTDNWPDKEKETQQKQLQESALQRPNSVSDLENFARNLILDGRQLFDDVVDTIVVPPLETADNVIRRVLPKVTVPIEAATIYEWSLEVFTIDLYFRPIFVFEFIHLDKDGNPVERKLEELDALKKDRWVNLETTEFQMPTVPWMKILKLSADIGAIVLKDIPIIGTTMKVASAVASQGPDIVNDMKR